MGIFALSFALVAVYIPQNWNEVKKAEAGALADQSTFTQQTIQTAIAIAQRVYDAATSAFNQIQAFVANNTFLKDFTLDGLAWVVAKQILSNMAGSIVSWINSGFEGSPAFVTNLKDFVADAANEAALAYLVELDANFATLCEPFNIDLQIALEFQFNTESNQRVAACTVTQVFDNLESSFDEFTEDFARGGWDAWFEVTVNNDTNTPYGVYYASKAKLDLAVFEVEANERQTLNFGKGFLTSKKCVDVPGPGTSVQKRCTTTTPGDTISEALSFQLSTGPQSLIAADEINEILSALFTQLAQKAVTGAGGLLGLTDSGSGSGGGSYLGDLNRETGDSSDFRTRLEEALLTERTYVCVTGPTCDVPSETAQNYEGRLRAFARTSDDADRARLALAAADSIEEDRPRFTGNIVTLTQMLATLDRIDAELDADNSSGGRTRYSDQLSTLTTQFSRLRLTTQDSLEGDIQGWNAILEEFTARSDGRIVASEGDIDLNDDGFVDQPVQCSGGIAAQCTAIPCAGETCPYGGIDIDGDGNAGDRLRCTNNTNCTFIRCAGSNCISSPETRSGFDLNGDGLTGDSIRCSSTSRFTGGFCDIIPGDNTTPVVSNGLDLNGDGVAGDQLYCSGTTGNRCYIIPCDGGSCADNNLGNIDLNRDGRYGDVLSCPTIPSSRFPLGDTNECRVLPGNLEIP